MGHAAPNARRKRLSRNWRPSMQVVEQHVMRKSDPRYEVIDQAAFASKNLYNAALYEMRQAFIFQQVRFTYPEMHARMKSHDAYQALPAKVAQQVLRLLDKNWKAWEEATEAWDADPSQSVGRPGLPKYKEKQQGRNILVYTIQALSKRALQRGMIAPSACPSPSRPGKRTSNKCALYPGWATTW